MLILFLLLSYLLLNNYWTKDIEKEFLCTFLFEEKENVLVKLSGISKKSFIKKDLIEYEITIGNKTYPELILNEIVLMPNYEKNPSIVDKNTISAIKITSQLLKNKNSLSFDISYMYYDKELENLQRKVIGLVYTDKKFENIVVILNKTNKENGSSVLVSNNDLEESFELYTKYTK